MKNIYSALSRVKYLAGSYSLKFLFIAFVGIHVPLLGVIAVLLSGSPSALAVFVVTLSCTLIACVLTLYVLRSLLVPLHRSYMALKKYLYEKELPHLPMHYPDEAGQLMRKVQLTLQQLDSLLKEKQELAVLLSHDVRAPLTNIAGLAALIKDEEDLDIIQVMAGKLADQATGQLRFVDDILNKMRLADRYEDKIHVQHINLRELTEKVIDGLDSQLRAKNLEVRNQIDKNLSLGLNQEQIGHVLLNLLTNAIKFSHADTTIQLTADIHETDIRIHIRDQGMGFNTEEGSKLFNRYTPGRIGTNGEQSTGIGLHLAKKIMEQHGGTITANSAGPEQGAVFSLVFPIHTPVHLP